MKIKISISILLATCALGGWQILHQQQQISALESALKASQSVNEKRIEKAESKPADCSVASSQRPLAESTKPSSELPNLPQKTNAKPHTSSEGMEEMISMSVAEQLSSVEQLVALTSDERAKLRKQFASEFTKNSESSSESLKDVLGEEKYNQYKKAQLSYQQRLRTEMRERELFTLSRKLALSTDQEARVESILQSGQELYSALSNDDESTKNLSLKERTKLRLQNELQRQEYNAKELQRVLSEEQYNKYLEIQATSSANLSHTSFVNAADNESSQGKP